MVYGLNIKAENGLYPKVNWEGEELPATLIPVLNPVDDGGVSGDSYHAGRPVDGSNFPKWVKWGEPHGGSVPDFEQIPYLNVSDRAKNVIESLEPNAHQFFPVDFQDHDGSFRETRYWFVPCNRLDSIDRQRSNMVLLDGVQWTAPKTALRLGAILPPNVDPTLPAKYVFRLSAIGNKHIWRDKHVGGSACFLSDAMGDLFKREGLTGLAIDESRAEAV